MSELTPLREAVDTLASRTPPPDFDEIRRRATRRGRRRVAMVGVAAVALIAGSALASTGFDVDRRSAPAEVPVPDVGAVPVWYDANGLHRGSEVEETPVELIQPERPGPAPGSVIPQEGALALVRSGAVYLAASTGDVWFHPWGGEPRIVGHDSDAGPGGDPNGDTAVWFEGSDAVNGGPGELVVFDTATGREISRTSESRGVAECVGGCGDHYPAGNGFLQVSADQVVWNAWDESYRPMTYRHDVQTGTTSVIAAAKDGGILSDVHDQLEIKRSSDLVLRLPGEEARYPDVETHARLSPSGDYLLAPELTANRHAGVIIDTRTGALWRVPGDGFPWIAWSYGDVALVDTEAQLLACDAARSTCEQLPAERPFLMPTN